MQRFVKHLLIFVLIVTTSSIFADTINFNRNYIDVLTMKKINHYIKKVNDGESYSLVGDLKSAGVDIYKINGVDHDGYNISEIVFNRVTNHAALNVTLTLLNANGQYLSSKFILDKLKNDPQEISQFLYLGTVDLSGSFEDNEKIIRQVIANKSLRVIGKLLEKYKKSAYKVQYYSVYGDCKACFNIALDRGGNLGWTVGNLSSYDFITKNGKYDWIKDAFHRFPNKLVFSSLDKEYSKFFEQSLNDTDFYLMNHVLSELSKSINDYSTSSELRTFLIKLRDDYIISMAEEKIEPYRYSNAMADHSISGPVFNGIYLDGLNQYSNGEDTQLWKYRLRLMAYAKELSSLEESDLNILFEGLENVDEEVSDRYRIVFAKVMTLSYKAENNVTKLLKQSFAYLIYRKLNAKTLTKIYNDTFGNSQVSAAFKLGNIVDVLDSGKLLKNNLNTPIDVKMHCYKKNGKHKSTETFRIPSLESVKVRFSMRSCYKKGRAKVKLSYQGEEL